MKNTFSETNLTNIKPKKKCSAFKVRESSEPLPQKSF